MWLIFLRSGNSVGMVRFVFCGERKHRAGGLCADNVGLPGIKVWKLKGQALTRAERAERGLSVVEAVAQRVDRVDRPETCHIMGPGDASKL